MSIESLLQRVDQPERAELLEELIRVEIELRILASGGTQRLRDGRRTCTGTPHREFHNASNEKYKTLFDCGTVMFVASRPIR